MKNIKDYLGKSVAIHCETEGEFNDLLDLCYLNKIDNDGSTYEGYDYFDLGNNQLEGGGKTWYEGFGYTIIEAKDFFDKPQDVGSESHEFGERIGSLPWALNVAEKEGEVYHGVFGRCIFNRDVLLADSSRFIGDRSDVVIGRKALMGWKRKQKTPEEELIEEILEWSTTNKKKLNPNKIVEKFEIKRK